MQLKISLSPRKIIRYLTIGVIFFTLVSVGIQICKYSYGYRADWMQLFNVDRELNFPTWYSALTIAFCAILLRIIAAGKKQQGDRYTKDWQLLSLIFWFMAIDEVLSIHEILIIPEISNALNLPWFLHSMWVIPGTIFVIWFIRRYSKFTSNLPYISRKHFFLAASCYIGGALLMEMVGSYIAEAQGQQNLVYALTATVEEAMEMSGIVIFVYGLLCYLRQWADKFDLEITILNK
ncbi:hypothetical protein I4641_05015 [Waterburya agarophytonicola K14]|uniref:Uncharacterized protein n=1 Tax=Waterburya agarophytonicola KI4 TaxID=2874699 RepID=A0A964FEW7_9CYAN|nr:hypothetical protein [Waterburya agarophytonicola]MCC0176336.1 hypothetical protein [Waterburya agarophytonicola KI4]